MATNALIGISKIEYGTPEATGIMPTSLTKFGQIVPDSVVMTFDEPDKTDIYIEGQDAPYITLPNTERVRALAFKVRDMTPATLVLFFGGAVATSVWSAPTSESAIFYALKATSKTYDTTLFEIAIPKVLILASLDGKMYKQETSEISINAQVQAPNTTGAAVSPISITKTN